MTEHIGNQPEEQKLSRRKRLRAAGKTLLVNPVTIKRIGESAVLTAGLAVGIGYIAPIFYTTFPRDILINSVYTSVWGITSYWLHEVKDEQIFIRKKRKAKPGTTTTREKPGSVLKALETGKVQRPKIAIYVKGQ